MDFIDAGTVLELLDKRTEEMTAEVAAEARKAAANSFTIHSLRLAIKVVTEIRNEIGLMLALPGYPASDVGGAISPPNPPETFEEGSIPGRVSLPMPDANGDVPEENSMDPLYGDCVADTMTPGPEPDTTPPTEGE